MFLFQNTPVIEHMWSFYLIIVLAVITVIYSVYKLSEFSKYKELPKMKCPECGATPFRIFPFSFNISIAEYLKGKRKCIQCETHLVKHYSNVFYICLILVVVSYIIMQTPLLFEDFTKVMADTIYIYIGIAFLGYLAAITLVVTTAFTTRYSLDES